ncbi:MAG: hypothetical protein GY774_17865 [Planctomycetes bacterium]|nr:hypothetical protein [Planctomycetota bacterium]
MKKVALVLGAGERTKNIIEALSGANVEIEGVYDKNPNASALDIARRFRIPLYIGDSAQLPKMLNQVATDSDTEYYLFLASDHSGFLGFAHKEVRSLRMRAKNFKLLSLGIDFDSGLTADDIRKIVGG